MNDPYADIDPEPEIGFFAAIRNALICSLWLIVLTIVALAWLL